VEVPPMHAIPPTFPAFLSFFVAEFSGCPFFRCSFFRLSFLQSPFSVFVISGNNFVLPFFLPCQFSLPNFPVAEFFVAHFPLPLFHTLILCWRFPILFFVTDFSRCPIFRLSFLPLPFFSVAIFTVAVFAYYRLEC